ncbi:MAG: PDZ domain-containing protein, partial [Planctomycetota bacterium]
FLDKIVVTQGEHERIAIVSAIGIDGSRVTLQLEEPLPGSEPLSFEGNPDDAVHSFFYAISEWRWYYAVSPVSFARQFQWETEDETITREPRNGILLNEDGEALGIAMGRRNFDTERCHPDGWDMLNADEYAQLAERIEGKADRMILRTRLDFRSPRQDDSGGMHFHSHYYDDSSSQLENDTRWNGLSVVLDSTRVLVLASLDADTTARLETISVFDQSGNEVSCSFVGSLDRYGALIAERIEGSFDMLNYAEFDRDSFSGDRLFAESIAVRGEERHRRFWRSWLSEVSVGRRDRLIPELSSTSSFGGDSGWGYYGPSGGFQNFFFTPQVELMAFPLAHRSSASDQNSWRYHDESTIFVEDVAAMLGELDEHLDLNNIPLSEEEENRLAWLGVEVQPIEQELARINNIVEPTNDGTIGGIVNHIYKDSPAEELGIQIGDVIVRLHSPDEPRPIDLSFYDDSGFGFGGFDFWSMIDEMPAEYFSQLPTPWTSAENTLNNSLKDIGFGEPITVELYRDGEQVMLDTTVEQGPSHYGAAERHKFEGLGFSVREITFEVRRYYRRSADDPGVIVSKVESGESAAIGGLRPYEIITHIDGDAVSSIDELVTAIENADGQDQIELTVRRLTQGRVLKIRL